MTQPRRASDINQAFDQRVTPRVPGMRFELEIAVLIDEHESDLESALIVVCWRYDLGVRETMKYFDAADGLRLPN